MTPKEFWQNVSIGDFTPIEILDMLNDGEKRQLLEVPAIAIVCGHSIDCHYLPPEPVNKKLIPLLARELNSISESKAIIDRFYELLYENNLISCVKEFIQLLDKNTLDIVTSDPGYQNIFN